MEISNVLEILKSARNILEPDGAWTQGCLARNKDKEGVDVLDDDAVCFCAVGALNRAYGKQHTHSAIHKRLSWAMNGFIAPYNDQEDTTQLHVLMAYDFAILMAEDELNNLK